MNKLEQAARQALEALQEYRDTQMIQAPRKAIIDLREALAEQAEREPVATDLMDMLRLIETIKYLRGIAERGLGREIRDDETIEQFVLGYVKQLEATPVRTKDLTDDEIRELVKQVRFDGITDKTFQFARAVIAADRELNK